MNKLSELFLKIKNGDTVTLKKDCVYDVFEEDSFLLKGYFCSNSAKKHENPDGERKTAIYLKNKKNITINGNGAKILVHGKMTPILLDRCENIKITDLVIDYACPTMTEFEITNYENGYYDIKINDDCFYEIEGNKLFWIGELNKNGVPYWKNGASDQGRYCKLYNPKSKTSQDFSRDNLNFESIEETGKNLLRIKLKNTDNKLPVGSILQTRSIVRDQVGSLFERCKNLEFSNLRVMFMHGLGMVSQFCENVTFKNCDFTPKANRTITSTADFFQFSGCKGDIFIENCKATGAHDDYINVHGTHLRIIKADFNENSVILKFMHPETWGFQAFEIGDTVEFIKWDTLIPYYSATVAEYKKISDTDILLHLDRALPKIEINKDVLENASYTPNLYVKNCTFGETSGRGILATTRGKVTIENNTFTNLWGPALLIEDDCNFWFESGYTRNITFKNNVLTNCDYAAMYPFAPFLRCSPMVLKENPTEYVHGSVVIENNVFNNSVLKKHTLFFEHIKEAVIKNNIFDAPYQVLTNNTGNVITENNIIK